ncbi:sugar porter family MFS transporter NDAI_0B03060 [Naumovozyma dairenensis CBS 421]|uniref:Major facilitator superfamily (MFS) profile domain-containing protein n=1 Tax=Naumovozyma dairenensis (strain ATCC 10597 / BCRC 20456 / CBS 421 / NBRC 0211 / NRRL Y-12639) TaxID=1071378 RepID=G0W6D0_NAUDC|nr:hypothetical protein NDAI_0B03060 [Naumovozyma dairenensis CBS 421]CCD23341.1 hypothetical protein NDAI_0B03060 [Naumovozyma dairenensis CBS 421]
MKGFLHFKTNRKDKDGTNNSENNSKKKKKNANSMSDPNNKYTDPLTMPLTDTYDFNKDMELDMMMDDYLYDDEDRDRIPRINQLPRKPLKEYVVANLLCLCVAFGGFMTGWDTGTISGFVVQTDFIRRFGHLDTAVNTYVLSRVRLGLLVSIVNIGCAIGGIVLSKAGDVYGRRKGLTIVTMVYMVGIIIQISAVNKWYQYFIGRIIAGFGIGGIAVFCPILISEISPKYYRGTCVSFYQLMITAGIFVGYCTNFGTKKYTNSVQWRVPLGLSFAWSLFYMILVLTVVPESPRYLCENNQVQKAKESIARSNRVSPDDPAVQTEMDFIMVSVESEKLAGNAAWGELFSKRSTVFQRVIMGIMIQMLQQLTGNNYFFYYGTIIFKSVGLEDSFQTSIIIGVVNFASTFVALYTVDRIGRRSMLLWGCLTMISCMVIYSSVGVTRLYPNSATSPSKGAGACMICFTCFYIFCYAISWAPIAWVIVSESFPLRVRSKCMALACASNWIWGFLISFFTPFITGAINFYYGYVFTGCIVFSFFYVFFFIPETKGLSLEEIQELWEERVLPWKSTAWIPPSKRTVDYDIEALAIHDGPWYKAFF